MAAVEEDLPQNWRKLLQFLVSFVIQFGKDFPAFFRRHVWF
jgi:hypothetical protein